MGGIDTGDHGRHLLDDGPHGRIVGEIDLHLIADAPHQQSRMIAIFGDHGFQLAELAGAEGGVAVIGALARLAHPQAGNHLQPQRAGRVEQRPGVLAIAAHRGGAEAGQQRQRPVAGDATHGEGLAVDEDVPPLHRHLHRLRPRRAGNHRRGEIGLRRGAGARYQRQGRGQRSEHGPAADAARPGFRRGMASVHIASFRRVGAR